MTGARAVDVYYDPFDFEIDDNPYPTWKRMRDEAPLYHNEKFNFFALSRYEDVSRELPNYQTYRSGRGTTMDVIMSGIEVPPGVILFEDPPLHDLHRRVLSKVFTPRRMEEIEPLTRQYCVRTLDPLIGSGRFDFITDLGAQIPMRTIGYLLGIPEQDQQHIRDKTDRALGLKDGTFKTVSADMFENSYQLFAEYIDWRADHPSDDLMTQLLNAEIEEDGVSRPLTRTEVLTYTSMIAGAGNETTTRLIGFIGQLLSRTPRPTATTGRGLLADPSGDRGGAALRGALARAGAVRRPRHRMPWTKRFPKARSCCCSTVLPTATSGTSPTGSASTSTEQVGICRSGRVCTSVSGRHWRGCRHVWH